MFNFTLWLDWTMKARRVQIETMFPNVSNYGDEPNFQAINAINLMALISRIVR